jgi:hypothetical protein
MGRKWVARCLGVHVVAWIIAACSAGNGGSTGLEGRGSSEGDANRALREAGAHEGAEDRQETGGAVGCTPRESTVGLVGPGDYAAMHGCQPTRKVSDVDCAQPRSELRTCDGASSDGTSDLPCGACHSGDRCYMAVKPMCDCDGEGPEPPFVQDPGTGLVDGWICECRDGMWACYLLDQSGSSCSNVCGDAGHG